MPGGSRSYEMARRLVAAGHEVDLITSNRVHGSPGGWTLTVESGIRVHWYPVPYSNAMGFASRVFAFFRFAYAAARKAASLKGDVVFATSTPLTIVFPGLFAARRLRVPLVFEVRDMWPAVPIAMGYLTNPLLKKASYYLERLAYRKSSHIVALAPGMRDDIVATGIPSDKITVIPNGCDTDIFGVDFGDKIVALRASYTWLKHRKLIVFTGTFGRANGVVYLVKLAKAMFAIDPEVRFVAIGDGAEWEEIANTARSYSLLGVSFFMFSAMPKIQLASWVAASNFTVGLFSGPRVLWKDAVQNKFFDSLAAGRPVACNFSGFQSELAVEEGVGLILSPSNPSEAARSLYDKLNDAHWNASANIRAKQLARHEFSRDFLADRLEAVLIAAVAKRVV